MKQRVTLVCAWIFRALYNLVYAPLKCLPVQKKLVMLSRQSDAVSPDFTAIAEELHRADPALRVVFLCRELHRTPLGLLRYGFHLLFAAGHLATAALCVTDGYSIPVSVLRHRKRLYILQVWHSLGAVKKFGLQSLSDDAAERNGALAKAMCMHRNYSAIVCASRHTAKLYAEAFGTPLDRILPIGIPRVDAILRLDKSTAREALLRAYPALSGKRIVLFAPTFRRGGKTETEPLLRALNEAGFGVILRLHPLELAALGETPPYGALPCKEFDTFSLMAAADDVITDYSALSIEASLLDKPVWFFVPDIDAYSKTPGLNFDPLTSFPRCAFRDAEALRDAMTGAPYDFDALRRFRDTQVETRDTNCTKRIAELLLSHLGDA